MAAIALLAERMRLGFGVDLMVDQLAAGLSKRGHDVTVFTCFSDGTYERGEYKIVPLAIPARGEPFRWDLDARAIARGSGLTDLPFDLWFAFTPPFFALLPLLRGRGIAVDCGVSDSTGMSPRQRRNFRRTELLQQRWYFRSAAKVVTISRWLQDQLPTSLSERSVPILLGADHYALAGPQEREAARSRLGVGEDDVLSLYVGRLNPSVQPYKGTERLLRIHRQVAASDPRSRLALVGFGDDADAAWIRASGGIPVVHAPVDQMPSLLAAADVYTTASAWEGFDLPLVEAQRSGKPVVAFRVGAHPEVVDAGRSGFLVDDEDAFGAAVRRFVADPALRNEMGTAAADWTSRFRWEDSVTAYDTLVRSLLGKIGRILPDVPRPPSPSRAADVGAGRRTSGAAEPHGAPAPGCCFAHPPVSALILNYGAGEEMLTRCVASVLGSRCRYLLEVVVVDNGSQQNRAALETAAALDPRVRIVPLGHNYGFAGGINRGLAVCNGEWVLILNNDTEVDAGAIDACAAVLSGEGPQCLAAVPKLLLRDFDAVIDAVGNSIDGMGRAFNQGIGQLDVGQYDRPARVFGPCFAAALFRRSAFDVNHVGPLDASYFMYYEDVDWSWRANLWGYRFQSAPAATVYHEHSKTTREQPFEFKVRQIQGNLLTTVVKNMPRESAVPVLRHHVIGHLRAAAGRKTPLSRLGILVGAAARFPDAARRRRWVKQRQVVPDGAVMALAEFDPCLFDDTRYAPVLDLSNLFVAYRRKWARTGDDRWMEIADRAAYLSTHGWNQPGVLRRDLLPLLDGEPDAVRDLVRRLDPSTCDDHAGSSRWSAG